MTHILCSQGRRRRPSFAAVLTLIAATFFTLGNAVSQPRRNLPAQIVVIGDSNVEGRAVRAEARYPAQLQAALRHNGYSVIISNRGIYGDRISGVLRRLDRDTPRGTKLAVVWVGINDARRGATTAQIRNGHAAIRRQLRARGIASVFITPPAYDVSLHRNSATRVSFIDPHLNARGYSIMLQRTYRQIERALRGAGVRKNTVRRRNIR